MSEYLPKLISILENYTNFLGPFKTLLNTHNLQFIVENHWSNESILNLDLRKDLEHFLIHASSNNTPPNLVKYFHLLNDSNANDAHSSLKFLNQLFLEIKSLNDVWSEKVLTKPECLFMPENQELIEFEKNYERQFAIVERQNRFMNNKKAYEVDIMSKFVAKLCKMVGLQTVSLQKLNTISLF